MSKSSGRSAPSPDAGSLPLLIMIMKLLCVRVRTGSIMDININKENEIQVFMIPIMNISKKSKKGTYPVLNIGDDVSVPVVHKQHKGYKDSFSMEMHKVEDRNRGSYTVDGSLHPRKDAQSISLRQ